MAKLILDNLPDELLEQIEKLAQQKNHSIKEQTINLLKIALEKAENSLNFLVSSDGNYENCLWEAQQKNTVQILTDIENRRKIRENQTDIEWLDSTKLIREDRDK